MHLLSPTGFGIATVILEAIEQAAAYRGIAKYIAFALFLVLLLWMALSSDSITPSLTQLGVSTMAINARARTRRIDGISEFTREDPNGRQTVPETRGLLGERRLRKWASQRSKILFRVKNGINDPITYFHFVDALANVRPNQRFTAGQLAEYLNEHKTMLAWDPITVGRILNDIIESTLESTPGRQHQPIEVIRTWAGREYMVTDFPAARAVLFNLLDDLAALGEKTVEQQGKGNYAARTTSPLSACPSLDPMAAAMAG